MLSSVNNKGDFILSTIKLEIPSDNKLAVEAAAMFFAHLCDLPVTETKPAANSGVTVDVASFPQEEAAPTQEQTAATETTAPTETSPTISQDDLQQYPRDRGDGTMVDFEGRIWDKRIDSSNKKCYKDSGLWMRRKSIEDAFYNTVRAEVMQASQQPAQTQQTPAATQGDDSDVGNAFPPQGQQQASQTPQQAPVDTSGAVDTTESMPVADYFRAVMTGGFTTEQQAQVSQEFGVESLSNIVAMEQTMPGIMQQVVNRLNAIKQGG